MPEDEREGVWDIKRGDKRSEAGGVFGGEHVEGGKKKKKLSTCDMPEGGRR